MVGISRYSRVVSPPMTLPGAQESLTLRSLAPAYCASFTLSAKAKVFRMRARSSSIVYSLSSYIVASALHLVGEMLHVRRETADYEHADVEFFGGRILLSLVETGLQILQV